ncbi:hypothetical protein A3K86_16425 [Photobacterium jeanii]|uniref:Copper resistance protein n=1 Tax=Photobacterium jeanii TaxID=858640 RepID=A0A178K7H0_9GAMM|nr:hypothetical protein A3K86_16425 [Photobacterium jeanii]PST89392.1 copper resistance protein [Photobacterium jeanii]
MYIAQRKQTQFTNLTLLLVWWVIGVCLANNMGLLSGCTQSLSHTESVQKVTSVGYVSVNHHAIDTAAAQHDSKGLSTKCDLSEHLITFEQLQVAQYALLTLLVALILVIGLRSAFHSLPIFTEPILQQGRRLHLTLCVFRE